MSTFPARDKLSSKTSALLSPKLTPENQAYEIKKLQLWEGRKKTVFNFCFQMLYPYVDELKMRGCIREYGKFTIETYKQFGTVFKYIQMRKRSKNQYNPKADATGYSKLKAGKPQQ